MQRKSAWCGQIALMDILKFAEGCVVFVFFFCKRKPRRRWEPCNLLNVWIQLLTLIQEKTDIKVSLTGCKRIWSFSPRTESQLRSKTTSPCSKSELGQAAELPRRAFCEDGNLGYLDYPMWKSLVTHGYGTPDIWLRQSWGAVFFFLFFFFFHFIYS